MNDAVAALLLAAVLLGACSSDAPPVAAPDTGGAARDSAYAALTQAGMEPLRQAFLGLQALSYTTSARTAQFGNEGDRRAVETRVVRHGFREGERVRRTVEADTSGAFSYGYLRPFVSGAEAYASPESLPRHMLPEDPPYLSARNRESFTYRLPGDTTIWGRPARVIVVAARRGAGDEQNVRAVRLYVDRATGDVVRFDMQRRGLALLFSEETWYAVELRPGTAGRWVPYRTRIDTRLRVPFRPVQRFHTEVTYGDYAPAS